MIVPESLLSRSVSVSISLVLFLAAWGCSFLPLREVQAEFFLLSVVLAGLASLFALAGARRIDLRETARSPVIVLFCVFWILTFISVLTSEVPFVAFIYFGFFSVFPLSFFLVQAWSRAQAEIAGFILAACFAALGIFALVQFYFLPAWLFNDYAAWPLANPNSLAALFAAGFFGALGWLLAARTKIQSYAALALCAILGAAIFTTGSRGAVMAALVFLPLALFLLRSLVRKHWRCLSVLCVLVPMIFMAPRLFSDTAVSDPVAESFRMGAALGGSDWSERKALWDSTWEMIQRRPWTGTGVGTFFLYYPEVRGADFHSAGFMAHFEPLQFWAEQGVFSVLVFYALLAAVGIASLKALKRIGMQEERRVWMVVAFCALASMTLHAHVTYNFHVLPLLFFAGIALAVWFRAAAQSSAEEIFEREDAAIRYGLSVPLVALLAVFALWELSEIAIHRAQQAAEEGRNEEYYALINTAGHLSGNRNARALIEAANIPLGIVYLNAAFIERRELADIYKQGMDLLDRAEEENPRLAQIYYSKAELLRSVSAFIKAEAPLDQEGYLRKALKIDPRYLPARMMLADLLSRQGKKPEAYRLLLEGLDWPYDPQKAKEYHRRITVMAQEQGDVKNLARIAEIMIENERERRKALAPEKPP